jgi:hypothetical protein
LAEESILSDDLIRQLINVGEVDLLVGVPTFNHAKTIGQVVQVIRAGLLQYFPRERTAILNADGGSRDGTAELVQAASISDARNSTALQTLRTLHCISSQYSGSPSSGTALHTIVAAAELLRAQACVVIAPDSTSITPEWIDRLLRPIYRDNFDFVTPVYRRHRFEGMLVTNLIYPMTRAIYAKRIREPYPAEFGFSGRLGSHLVGHDLWHHEAGQLGTEICLTVAAIAEGYRLHQSFLGPKGHHEQQPADLVPAMRQTVGTLFWSLEQQFPVWSSNDGTQAVPTVGAEYEVTTESVRVNRKRLHQMFCTGVAQLEPILKSIVSAATLEELKRMAGSDEEAFTYSDELWVKTIYEFAASYYRSVISRDHIIQALVPLYRGRVYTFLVQNREASADEVEQNIEALCLAFERLKPYLLELWSAGKGGS